MRVWPWVAVIMAAAGAVPVAAQPVSPSAAPSPALPIVTGKTGGETAAPGASGANDSVNSSGDKDTRTVAVASQPAPPHPVKPGMSMDEARQKLASNGLQHIEGFYLDVYGAWRATAVKDGQPVMAWVDAKGSVGQEPL